MTKKVVPVRPVAKSSQRNEIIVHANWRRIDGASPAFQGLMALLLQEVIKYGDKAGERGARPRGNEAR
jgi:hypothetical protein